MKPFRHQIYQHLGRWKAKILQKIKAAEDDLALDPELRGRLGLTGSASARPSYLKKQIVEEIARAATSPRNLIEYVDEIRIIVKEVYGDDYDACPVNSCEAALWLSLDVLASPPLAGRGDSYRSCYIGLYEGHGEHQLAYGRPFPPKYKDLFADRANIAGELGVLSRRLNNLDAVIVPLEGARYEVHGIKPFPVPLLTTTDSGRSAESLRQVSARHGDRLSAFVSLGYDSVGYGYGDKADGVTSDLKKAIGALARSHNVPYIVDNARGIPFLGASPADIGADIVLYSMDKVAGSPISGLIIGREDLVVSLQRAVGWHSERFGGGNMAYGKGGFSMMDPGREALVGQNAALRWVRDNRATISASIDRMEEIVVEEAQSLIRRYGDGIRISSSYNGGGVELNYADTWLDGKIGLPIFSTEDKAAGSNLIVAGVGELGILPPSCDEGNIVITPGRGLIDDDGHLHVDRTRMVVRGLILVLTVLGDEVDRYVAT